MEKSWKEDNKLYEYRNTSERKIDSELRKEVLKDMEDYKEVFEALAK